MGDTINGIIAGFVKSRHSLTPLSSDSYTHVDVTMLGIESLGGFIHSRGLLRAESASRSADINFSLAGIANSRTPGTMPSSRTSLNGGFCISYEFEATRAFVDFGLSTRVRIRAFRETANTVVDEGLFYNTTRITGWHSTGHATGNVGAILIPRANNIEDMINNITGQSSLMSALGEGMRDALSEGTLLETINDCKDLLETVINPNCRYILLSIVIIEL